MPQLRSWQVDHEGLLISMLLQNQTPSITIPSLGRQGTDFLYVVHSHDDTVKALDIRAYRDVRTALRLRCLSRSDHCADCARKLRPPAT